MCVAYIVPPGFAAKLCADVDRCRGRTLKSPDIWLAHYAKYCLWPPAFGDQGNDSQCYTDSKELGTDLYCSKEMRRAAEQSRRPLPALGAPEDDVLKWQAQELDLQRKMAQFSKHSSCKAKAA